MGNKTPLFELHRQAGAKIVDFAGWDMPVHYGSQIEEHHAVRRAAGMFDVSHMTVVDLSGDGVKPFLQRLLANNVDKLTDGGQALYSCMLNDRGGVIDDLIVYYLDDRHYRMVVNAATRDKDIAWLNEQARAFAVNVDERAELAMIAVQGPDARARVHARLPADLRAAAETVRRFSSVSDGSLFVGRTGYTGEDGYELILPAADAVALWRDLQADGVAPVGLGARDTLRLEAAMNLYGSDMDENTTPLESGLGWTVGWEPAERRFIGRDALEAQKDAGVADTLVGLVMQGKGVLRDHQQVITADGGSGGITSGGFSPTLGKGIALARVPAGSAGRAEVDIRGKPVPVTIVKPPFVRNGKALV